MSHEPPGITEADLHAYVDGALEPHRRAAVERHLAGHPEQAEQVAEWRRQGEALVALYGRVADEPVPPRLDVRRIAAGSARLRAWSRIAAAALLCLIVGATGGWIGRGYWARPGQVALVDAAVTAHEIYAREVVHPVEVGADRQAHLTAWLSRRLDRALAVPDLRRLGFAFVGGRLLPAQDRPAAQLMYEDEAGQRVTLLIVPAAGGEESSLRFRAFGELKSLLWTDEGISCVIVGSLPRDRLRDIALHAYEQLG
jgi:anti-sigma factor RsiW